MEKSVDFLGDIGKQFSKQLGQLKNTSRNIHSYTKKMFKDTVELQVHGSRAVIGGVTEALLSLNNLEGGAGGGKEGGDKT